MSMLPAIYVHNTSGVRYADAIVQGYKPIETRTRDVLGAFVGRRVLVIRTCPSKRPMVIGSVFVREKVFHDMAAMEYIRDLTLIPPGSRFDCHGKGKWCYMLGNPIAFSEPIPLESFHVVRRTRSYAVIEYPVSNKK